MSAEDFNGYYCDTEMSYEVYKWIKQLEEQNKKLLSLVSRAYNFVEDGDFHHDIRSNWCKEAREEIIR